MTDTAKQALIAALVEARAMIITAVSNAMVLEVIHNGYDVNTHPVVEQIDAALAAARGDQKPPAPFRSSTQAAALCGP